MARIYLISDPRMIPPQLSRTGVDGEERLDRILKDTWLGIPEDERLRIALYWDGPTLNGAKGGRAPIELHPGWIPKTSRAGKRLKRWVVAERWQSRSGIRFNASVVNILPDERVAEMVAAWLAEQMLDAAQDGAVGALRQCRVDNQVWRWGLHPFARETWYLRNLIRWDFRSGPVLRPSPLSAKAEPAVRYDYPTCMDNVAYQNYKGMVEPEVEAELLRCLDEGTLPRGRRR